MEQLIQCIGATFFDRRERQPWDKSQTPFRLDQVLNMDTPEPFTFDRLRVYANNNNQHDWEDGECQGDECPGMMMRSRQCTCSATRDLLEKMVVVMSDLDCSEEAGWVLLLDDSYYFIACRDDHGRTGVYLLTNALERLEQWFEAQYKDPEVTEVPMLTDFMIAHGMDIHFG